MNIHSTLGYELLKTQNIKEETLDLVKYHHQNLKHSGYPRLVAVSYSIRYRGANNFNSR